MLAVLCCLSNANHNGNQDNQGIHLKGYSQENCKMLMFNKLQNNICCNFIIKLSCMCGHKIPHYSIIYSLFLTYICFFSISSSKYIPQGSGDPSSSLPEILEASSLSVPPPGVSRFSATPLARSLVFSLRNCFKRLL